MYRIDTTDRHTTQTPPASFPHRQAAYDWCYRTGQLHLSNHIRRA